MLVVFLKIILDKNPFGKYSYFCSPEELDARHYAYSLLIKNKTLAPYFRHGEYIEEEINNEVDYPMDYVKLLKDKKLRGYKFASLPLKNLEKEIKEIAKLNNLIYVGQGSKKSKSPFKNRNEKRANNLYLSLAINEKIAPLFNSPQFTEKTNGPRVESRIDDEMIEFFMKFEPSFVIEFKIDENDKEQETPSDEQETDKSSD